MLHGTGAFEKEHPMVSSESSSFFRWFALGNGNVGCFINHPESFVTITISNVIFTNRVSGSKLFLGLLSSQGSQNIAKNIKVISVLNHVQFEYDLNKQLAHRSITSPRII